jgi:hypothetical protein
MKTSTERRTFSLTIELLANAAQKLIETSIAAISAPNLCELEQFPDFFGANEKFFCRIRNEIKLKKIFF